MRFGRNKEEDGNAKPEAADGPDAPPAVAPVAVPSSTKRPPVDIREKSPRPPVSGSDAKTLVVGRGIILKGEIQSCDKLVIEGHVEAMVDGCREIEISETGTLKSEADIESADIRGAFDGALTARELLIVRAPGRITGKIRAGKLEVERGGQIIGDLEILASGDAPATGERGTPPPAAAE